MISAPCEISISSPNCDSPVTCEMERERPGRRARRRILRRRLRQAQHPRLPAGTGPGEAVDPHHRVQVGEPRHVRTKRGHRFLGLERHVDDAGARCRRPRPAARNDRRPSAPSSSASCAYGSTVGRRLLHPAEDEARISSRSSRTGTTPFPVSILITSSCKGPPRMKAVPRVGCPRREPRQPA